jgi:large subunit ribosomal protein L21
VGPATHAFVLSFDSKRVTRGEVQVYAVVETGGKQYRVEVGDSIQVERLDAEPGADVTLDRVLMLSDDGSATVGRPTVDGAKVIASVAEQGKGEKIRIFKMKQGYRKSQGHRQKLTTLTIKDIVGA